MKPIPNSININQYLPLQRTNIIDLLTTIDANENKTKLLKAIK